MTTESALRDWRYGQTQAERLAAALLHLEGFEAVDPQHPLGGPDGLKDSCAARMDSVGWLPPTSQQHAQHWEQSRTNLEMTLSAFFRTRSRRLHSLLINHSLSASVSNFGHSPVKLEQRSIT